MIRLDRLGDAARGAAAAPRRTGAGRSRVAVPLQRHDRAAEARHAHARQHDGVPARRSRTSRRVASRPPTWSRIAIPFPHLFGSAILTHALSNGATVVTTPTFQLDEFLRMLHDYAATVVPATPPLVAALARHPLIDGLDLSAVRLVIASAAPCAPELQEAVEARLGCVVGDYLGLTEAWCVSPAADPVVRGSVGRLSPNLEAMIVDPESGHRLGPDAGGELWIRRPQVMAGYVGVESDTPDGWFATGDLCRFDTNGNIYMLDRLKELIKVGGNSVAPAEVERELVAHPAVADAAVVGHPDSELGQVPVAYVALHTVEAGDLHAWLADRLAPWKRPREVVVVEQRPALARRQAPAPSPFSRHEPAELRPARHAELGERRREVVPDRALREVETLADLAVREAVGGERDHLALACRELIEHAAGRAARHGSATRASRCGPARASAHSRPSALQRPGRG